MSSSRSGWCAGGEREWSESVSAWEEEVERSSWMGGWAYAKVDILFYFVALALLVGGASVGAVMPSSDKFRRWLR